MYIPILNRQIRYYTYALFLFFSSVVIFPNSPLADVNAAVSQINSLVGASSNNFPPMNILDKDGNLIGFGRELSDAVIKEMGGEIEHIHSSQWMQVLDWLDTGRADFIHDTGYTKDRDKFLDYSDPILEMPEVIFVRDDEFSITSMESLRSKKVACVNKHITHLYLQQFPEVSCFIVKTPAEGIYELVSGKVDAFIFPKQIALYIIQNLRLTDKLKITGEPLRTLSWSMVVKEGNTEILKYLNEGISKVRSSGEYDRIYNKWWGEKVLSGYTKKQLIIFTSLTALVTLALALLITLFIFSLRLNKNVKERTALLAQEIEDRKIIENKLWEEKEFSKAVLDNIEDGIVACDKNGVLTVFNRATRTFHCLPEEHIPAEQWSQHYDLYHADGITPMETEAIPLYRALLGEYVNNTEMVIVPKQGRSRIILATGQPFYDSNDHILGAVVSMHDITERKQIEDELKRAHDYLEIQVENRTIELHQSYEQLAREVAERENVESKLRQSQKMEAIGTLAGGIAHDFNNILAAILGYAELARKNIPEDSLAIKHISHVLKAGYRAEDLVKHILTFSRKETQKRVAVKISKITNEVVELIRASIPSNIEINTDIDANCGNIAADPTEIHQVILNLCTNAAHSMDDHGGVLNVTLGRVELNDENIINDAKPGSYARIKINDTGTGIEADIIDKVFDPYFTTKETGKGSGMGLSVVHGIVKSHHGFITVDSVPKEGTAFYVYFPLVEDQTDDVQHKATALPTGTENILIIDDEEIIAAMNKHRAEILGYQAVAMSSSKDALELFRNNPDDFDLIITDQTMPELTGDQLARELRAIRPDIPIIISTGYSSKISPKIAKDLGINAFTTKPIDAGNFANIIREVLDNTTGQTHV